MDTVFRKYYSLKLFTRDDIQNFESEKKESMKIAKQITSNLGLYYENLEPVVENYVYKWFNMGFSIDMLLSISNYAFKTNVRTLEGMDKVLAKFHKMGILSMQSLNEYFDDVLSVDKKIKNILEEIGLSRHVNQFDRDKYKIWTESWHLPDDVIEYASSIAKGKDQPMQYLATILSTYHDKNIKTVEEAEDAFQIAKTKSEEKKENNKRSYSRDEMNAVFQSIEEIDV